MAKRNNHGVFYDAFLAHFALVAGAEGPVRKLVQAFPDYRLAAQMDRQGRFIEELGRTQLALLALRGRGRGAAGDAGRTRGPQPVGRTDCRRAQPGDRAHLCLLYTSPSPRD